MRAFCTFISALLLAAAVQSAVAQDAPHRLRFSLSWAFAGHEAPWIIADQRGYFRDEGLRVTVDRGFGSMDTIVRVASGAYDIGYADTYNLLRFLANNPDQDVTGVFMVMDRSALSVATMADGPIQTPGDLAGARIAAPPGDASRQVFSVFAADVGLAPASVRWVNINADLREAMLLRGQADAIAGHRMSIQMNLMKAGVKPDDLRFFTYSDHGTALFGHMLIVRRAVAEQNPRAVTGFIRAIVRGFSDMINDPADAVREVLKRDPLLDADIEEQRIALAIDSMYLTPNVIDNGMSAVDPDRFDDTVRRVARALDLATPVARDRLYTPRYLPDRADLMLTLNATAVTP